MAYRGLVSFKNSAYLPKEVFDNIKFKLAGKYVTISDTFQMEGISLHAKDGSMICSLHGAISCDFLVEFASGVVIVVKYIDSINLYTNCIIPLPFANLLDKHFCISIARYNNANPLNMAEFAAHYMRVKNSSSSIIVARYSKNHEFQTMARSSYVAEDKNVIAVPKHIPHKPIKVIVYDDHYVVYYRNV